MKALLLLLSILTYAQPSHDHPSVHGMAVVGKEKIYLSHLPMFHSPHDYQVLLEVEFDPALKRAYLESKNTSAETVYTVAPEQFVLPDMVESPRAFHVELFRGHFERAGTSLMEGTVTIKEVLLFKKFKPGEVKPEQAQFLLFGNRSEQFLAHAITAKPDFDQLLSVECDPKWLQSKIAVVELTGKNKPIANTGTLKGKIGSLELTVNILSSLYLEHGDLSM